MKVGDLVMYTHGKLNIGPVLLIELCDPAADTDEEALVMNEYGKRWVSLADLAPIDSAMELLSESR